MQLPVGMQRGQTRNAPSRDDRQRVVFERSPPSSFHDVMYRPSVHVFQHRTDTTRLGIRKGAVESHDVRPEGFLRP